MDETTTASPTPSRAKRQAVGLIAAGLLAGGALGLTGIASAADSAPTPSPGYGSSTTPPAGERGPCKKGSGAGQGQAPSTTPESGSTSSGGEGDSEV